MNHPWAYMCPPSWTPLLPPSLSHSLSVVPAHQPWAPCHIHNTGTGNLRHIRYITYFNAILSNHPTLTFSHGVQNSVPCIYVSSKAIGWQQLCSLKSLYLCLCSLLLPRIMEVMQVQLLFKGNSKLKARLSIGKTVLIFRSFLKMFSHVHFVFSFRHFLFDPENVMNL